MKHVLTVLALSLLLVGWSPPAYAVVDWFNAQVLRTGVSQGGGTFIRLTDLANVPAFVGKTFRIPNAADNEMLAIGLSALATNFSIMVRTDPDGFLPVIEVMYLENF